MFSIDPFPIVLESGGLVTVAAQITLKEVIDVGAKVSFKIKREGIISIDMPCVDIDGVNIGSW